MRVSCPGCGAELTLDVLLNHEAARRAVAAAMQVSAPLADRLMKYLALFRPARRQLSMDRVAALLEELLPLLREQRIERRGRLHQTDLDTWKQALDTVLAHRDAGRLQLPLKGHGYLLEIVAGLCERRERGEEERRERALRAGHRDLQARAEAASTLAELVERAAAPAPSGPREVPAESRRVLDALGIGRRRGGGVT